MSLSIIAESLLLTSDIFAAENSEWVGKEGEWTDEKVEEGYHKNQAASCHQNFLRPE